jgi:PAS domain S-box-containing protein
MPRILDRVAVDPLTSDVIAGIPLANPDGVLVLSPAGAVLWINPGGVALHAFRTADEVRGRDYATLWPPAIRDELDQAIQGAAAGRVTRLEGACPAGDGTPRWLEARFAPSAAGPAEPRIIGLCRDITERRLAERALAEARDRLDLTLSNARIIGLWDWDVVPDRVVADERFARLYSVDPARAAVGVPIAEFIDGIHPDDRDRVGREVEQALATGDAFASEYRVRRADGSVHHVLARGRCTYDAAGRPLRFPGVVVDVTDQRNAEQALTASKDRYRSLFTSIDAGFCIVEMMFDADGRSTDYRFVEVNPAFERHTGLDDAAGRWMRALAPMHEQHWFDIYGRIALTGESVRFENEAKALHRWYDVHAFRIGEPDRHQVAILFNDITARKRAEVYRRAMVELGDRLRELDEPAALSYVAAEILGRVLEVSRAGYGTIDPVAETVTIERDWNAPGIKTIAGVLKFREHGSYIDELKRGETVVCADAERDPRTSATADVLIAISAQAFVNMPVSEQGQPVGLLYLNHAVPREWRDDELAFMREVAERTRVSVARRRAEGAMRALAASLERQVDQRTAALQASEARLRTIFETSYQHQGMVALDGTLLDSNATALAGVGLTLDEVVGQKFWDTPWFAETPGLPELVQAAVPLVASGQTLNREVRINLPVGGWRWFDFTMRPLFDEAGKVTAILPEAIETTGRRRVEEQLRQAQKMEAVGQLTGGVAHDFNNLLQVISGSLELLAPAVAGDARAERRLANAQIAVNRGSKLASQMLAFGRRQALEPKAVNIGRLIAALDPMLRGALGGAVEVETVIGGGLWNCMVDPTQIENAVLNLAINARDAMDGAGKLTIEVGNASLDDNYVLANSDAVAGQYVMLAVTDTGSGMTPEIMGRVFEPFFSTKPEGRGSGLGLSMVYGFVKQSGGHVKLYSELGQGTTIRLYLPRVHQSEDVVVPVAPLPVDGGGETILVAEDDEQVRGTVVELLSELGYRVLKAKDARSALMIIESGVAIDLLFTDVVMPGPLRSPELARQARERLPGLAVLFTSGYTENAIVHGGRLDEGVELLAKPYTREALARKIRQVLGQRSGG